MTTAYTFVVTAEAGPGTFGPDSIGEEIAQLLTDNGWRVVPCNWAPDADTIADNVAADKVVVMDLNPPRDVHLTGFPATATACGIAFGDLDAETTGAPDLVTCPACAEVV